MRTEHEQIEDFVASLIFIGAMGIIVCCLLVVKAAHAQGDCVSDLNYINSHAEECRALISPAPPVGSISPAPDAAHTTYNAAPEVNDVANTCLQQRADDAAFFAWAFSLAEDAYQAERNLRMRCERRRR